jgi:peroxiredoxin
MAISEGDRLPDATFTVMGDEGPKEATTADVFGGKKVVLFGVPGAFTPTCHSNHLPTFLAKREELMAKGVDTIACVSVNDVFVLNAWSKATTAEGDIVMLADGSGDFTKKAGWELDLTERGLGVRSKRYVALVEDGTVKTLLVEDNPGEAEQSTADALLATM